MKCKLIGIGYSVDCPKSAMFSRRVKGIIKRNENENSLQNRIFGFNDNIYMIEYYFHKIGYQVKVHPCS